MCFLLRYAHMFITFVFNTTDHYNYRTRLYIKQEVIMPRGDKTDPNGAGAMSGRRMGFCVENTVPRFYNPETNYRGGGYFGFRHGFRGGNYQAAGDYRFRKVRGLFPSEPVNTKTDLGEQIKDLKSQLNELENQFKNLG